MTLDISNMSTTMDIMDLDHALVAFSALSQETRLKVFKILVEYGSTGTAAGTISDRLGIPHNTLSFHLAQLSHVKLVSSRKVGRSIIYSANCDMINALIGFLAENCCIRESKGKAANCDTACCSEPRKKKGTRK